MVKGYTPSGESKNVRREADWKARNELQRLNRAARQAEGRRKK